MQLFYYRHKEHIVNYGDDLNPWLFRNILGDCFDDNSDELVLGIGTILNQKILPQASKYYVFSSGAGYGVSPVLDERWKIFCVRGPLTAKKLGIDKGLAITDGAILIRNFIKALSAKKYKYSFMPHLYQSINGGDEWRALCNDLGIHYIQPQNDIVEVMRDINDSELLITEALHGAVTADTLRVPWVAVRSNPFVFEFKWHDWCQSLMLEYTPIRILPFWNPSQANAFKTMKRSMKKNINKYFIRKIMRSGEFRLSKDRVCLERCERMNECVEELKRVTAL